MLWRLGHMKLENREIADFRTKARWNRTGKTEPKFFGSVTNTKYWNLEENNETVHTTILHTYIVFVLHTCMQCYFMND